MVLVIDCWTTFPPSRPTPRRGKRDSKIRKNRIVLSRHGNTGSRVELLELIPVYSFSKFIVRITLFRASFRPPLRKLRKPLLRNTEIGESGPLFLLSGRWDRLFFFFQVRKPRSHAHAHLVPPTLFYLPPTLLPGRPPGRPPTMIFNPVIYPSRNPDIKHCLHAPMYTVLSINSFYLWPSH